MFRSLSCSQSIRQRIRRRTVTLYFNLHWNSQILVHRSQDKSNSTCFLHCVELRFSNAQGFLKSGSRFHSVNASLSHQSLSCFFSRLDPAAKALSTKTDFVNAFLSSISQRRSGFPNQMSCCAFHRNKVECMRFTLLQGEVLRGFCKV